MRAWIRWGGTFDGDSFFDIFIDVQIENPSLGTLQATTCLDPNQPYTFFCQPFRVEADLTDVFLPPVQGVSYNHPVGEAVDLWVDPDPADPEDEFIIGRMLAGCHKPFDPAVESEHHVCVMGFGMRTPDGSGGDCLENNVRLVAVDASRPAHTVAAATAVPVGPVALMPFVPTLMGSMVVQSAEASTNVEQCAEVGADVVAIYDDLHTSPLAQSRWAQHA